LRKNFVLIMATLFVLALGYIYIAYGTVGSRHERPNEPVDRIQMHIELEGTGISAQISMYSVNEDDKKEGFVELPFSKYYLSSSTKITASSTKDGQDLTCRITDIDGRVLDKDGPAESVSCNYSTF